MNDQPLIKLHTLADPDPQPMELTQEQLDEQTAENKSADLL